MAAIHYRITPIHPEAHLFEVELTLTDPDPAGQVLAMPAWIPGSYMIRDFSRHVVTLRAEAGGTPLAVAKLDKDRWCCAPCPGPLRLIYQVYAWDLSVRAAHLDAGHGYFNGTCVFLAVPGAQDRPCTLDILPPPGVEGWQVATTLTADGAQSWGFGRYRAASYDELVDHPVEMGHFARAEFDAGGVPHALAATGRQRGDLGRLTGDLKRICETHMALFGGPLPMDRYLFQIMVVGEGYGGLEHRNSTSLLVGRDSLPRPGEAQVSEGYRELLGLCSHEYFHTWLVKRIKPAAFVPYDLSREVHTRLLWAFEGITSYYDELGLVRAEVIAQDSYLELLGRTITRVWRGSGRRRQSVAESSFDAWTRFYKADENAPNAIVSYYAKGALIALALDLTLRRLSDGARSLDDLMRALWQRHREGAGVPEDGVEHLAAEIAGTPLGAFFDHAVRGTEDLELEELLGWAGVGLHWRPASGHGDPGGKPAETPPPLLLGARIADDPLGVKLTHVLDEGPAQRAGLSANDVLIAVDGLRVTKDGLERLLAGLPAGETVPVHAFRRDELLTLSLRLETGPADTAYLLPLEGEAVTARRQAWLVGGGG
jgi:predicted metalloprotease with PDZ domain